MSFKCDNCNEAQPTYTKPNRVVLKTRNVTYKLNSGASVDGTEIVAEADLCRSCK